MSTIFVHCEGFTQPSRICTNFAMLAIFSSHFGMLTSPQQPLAAAKIGFAWPGRVDNMSPEQWWRPAGPGRHYFAVGGGDGCDRDPYVGIRQQEH